MINNKEKQIETVASEYGSKDFDRYFRIKRHEMLHYIPQEASLILDVGCAVGSFGQLLKAERSVEVWGVEINEYAASIAAQKLDNVVCGDFNKNLNLPSQSFDCIVFNDVLEHLVDPYTALIHAKELLTDKGVVVASIPNVRYFDNMWRLLVYKDWSYTNKGILDRTHLRFFTYKSILNTFKDLGYKVELIEGINPFKLIKFSFLNWILFKQIEDMRYLQFAVVARPNDSYQFGQ